MSWSDEYIEFWGNVFQACRLANTGLDFETFLLDPEEQLAQHGLTEILEPLLDTNVAYLDAIDTVPNTTDTTETTHSIPKGLRAA